MCDRLEIKVIGSDLISTITPIVSNLLLWFWVATTFLVWVLTKGKRRARIYGFGILALLWLGATRPAAEAVLWPLESPYTPPSIETLESQKIKNIAVLSGGGFEPDRQLLVSAFPMATTYRFLGALELASRLGSDCALVFSGGPRILDRKQSTAEIMKELSLLIMPERKAFFEANSWRTSDHPKNIEVFVGKKPFLLVTSATHMKRAVQSFERRGLHPIPYPVDFLIRGKYVWTDFFPSMDGLWKINVALREYLALALYAVKGW